MKSNRVLISEIFAFWAIFAFSLGVLFALFGELDFAFVSVVLCVVMGVCSLAADESQLSR